MTSKSGDIKDIERDKSCGTAKAPKQQPVLTSSSDPAPRYTGPAESDLSMEQIEIRQAILTGRPRTGLNGPFAPWLAVPAIARPAHELGKVCRYKTSLNFSESELVILLTGAKYKSDTEFEIHTKEALHAGLSLDIIQAIPRHDNFSLKAVQVQLVPLLCCPRQVAIALFTAELLDTTTVSDSVYQSTKSAMDGKDSVLVEITSIIGYYAFVCYTLNVFKILPK